MSRALNVNASPAHVTATCAKHNAGISAIEPLASGGTRVVLLNANDTAAISAAYGTKVMTGTVRRTPSRLIRG
ncbi:MAG TPA: hypothetical protein VF637_10870 [Sphingomicrobium sp.]|jgi:hypothetical protein